MENNCNGYKTRHRENDWNINKKRPYIYSHILDID